jgi:hypothetical protein
VEPDGFLSVRAEQSGASKETSGLLRFDPSAPST